MSAKLEREFEAWQGSGAGHAEDIVWIDATSKSANFLLNNAEFNLVYPASFPNHDAKRELFSVNTKEKSLTIWATRLNHSLQVAPPASLSELLTRAVETFYNEDVVMNGSNKDDDDASGNDYDDDEDEDEDDKEMRDESDQDVDDYEIQQSHYFEEEVSNWKDEIEVLHKRKRWVEKEKEIKEKLKREEELQAMEGKALGTLKAKVKNIFSSSGASRILTNDLLHIMQNSPKLGFNAEPVDHNIYHWNVKMHAFDPNSAIYSQLQEINKSCNYDYVELEVTFTIDLYPFYPPTVKVVRPRFMGFMMGRITSMELLKLSNWDPVRDMSSVISIIKDMLEEHGKLDVNNPMNNIVQYPKGAYSELEYLLLRLEILTELNPRANLKYSYSIPKHASNNPIPSSPSSYTSSTTTTTTTTTTTSPPPTTSEEQHPSKKSVTHWAKGTGYGFGTKKVEWDVNAFLAAQRQKDKELQAVIEGILAEISSPSYRPQFEILEESALVPTLESFLFNTSLLDIGKRASLYLALLNVINVIAAHESLLPLLDALPGQKKSILTLLADLEPPARVFLQRLRTQKGTKSDAQSIPESPVSSPAAPTSSNNSAATATTADTAMEDLDSDVIEKLFDTYKSTRAKLEKLSADIKSLEAAMSGRGSSSGSTAAAAAADDENTEIVYEKHLKPLSFDMVTINIKAHKYVEDINKNSPVSKEKVRRLAQEQASLATSLPVTFGSSVFVRVDEQHMDVMQALITGPDDTPYAGGAFLFDIFFPQTYPNTPPLVNLRTTGSGTVRFNPNLYDCGKVCLSLLGTWSGSAGENWNKDTSTILQVLVSIQSLIMVPMPFFNEPGYEAQIGTPQGVISNRNYNEVIRAATIEHAMIAQLKNPPENFERLVRTHFYLSKKNILRQCDAWLQEAQTTGRPGHYPKMLKLIKELKDELDRLQRPI